MKRPCRTLAAKARFCRALAKPLQAVCQCLAISLLVCQPLANARADGLRVREIRRKVNVDNLDRVDTVKWYAAESVRYTVAPHWRDGTHLEIPDGASASWIVADEAGTNWLARTGTVNAESNVVFSFSAGEGALPEGHDYTSFAALLDGTNVLGVIDRVHVEVLWQPQDDVVPVTPPASGWPGILAWVQDTVEGFVSSNSAAIADLQADVATNTAAILSLEERVALLWAEVFQPVAALMYGGKLRVPEDAGLDVPTHRWAAYEGIRETATPTVAFPDGRIWEACVAFTGTLTHEWRLSAGTEAHPPTMERDGKTFEMRGVYADGNTNQPTHEWRQK